MIKDVSEEQVQYIISAIRRHFPKAKIIAFGSRISGSPQKYSDLDLCLDNADSLSLSTLSMLEEELSESAIPFKIDFSDYHRLTKDFQKHVLKTGVLIG